MALKFKFVAFLFGLINLHVLGQEQRLFVAPHCPVLPNKKAELTGTFGELRPGHFHAGIDFRTNRVIGLPLHTIDDGAISKISISPYGYGKSIYIRHNNGLTSFYAHIDRFVPYLENYIAGQIIKAQNNELNLIPDTSLTLAKGEIFAYAGNTGSSQGPHLHFEILDNNDKRIDPLMCGFSEIVDTKKPYINAIAIQPLAVNSKVNGYYNRAEYKPKCLNGQCNFNDTISVSGRFGIEIEAFDAGESQVGKNGISCVELYFDGIEYYSFTIKELEAQDNQYINFHLNANEYYHRKRCFQRCFQMGGNGLSLNKFLGEIENGILNIAESDTGYHELKIVVFDGFGNKSESIVILSGNEPKTQKIKHNTTGLSYKIENKLLVINHQGLSVSNNKLMVYSGADSTMLTSSFQTPFFKQWVISLGKWVPDSVRLGNSTLKFNIHPIYPLKQTQITMGNKSILFPVKSVPDTSYFEFDTTSKKILFRDQAVLLIDSIEVMFKVNINMLYFNKVAGFVKTPNRAYGMYNKAHYTNRLVSFKTNRVGAYSFEIDSVGPRIVKLNKTPLQASFAISDDLSGIYKYEVRSDGVFLPVYFDYKNAKITTGYIPNYLKPLRNITVLVTDGVGNTTELKP